MELSKSYAGALFSLAAENGAQDEVKTALDVVAQALRENPDYIEFLAAPSIPMDERSAALDAAFGGRVPEVVLSFLQVLCRRGHARSFFACAEEYRRLLDHAKRVAQARIVSAVELSAGTEVSHSLPSAYILEAVLSSPVTGGSDRASCRATAVSAGQKA